MGIGDMFSRMGMRGQLLRQMQDEDHARVRLNERKMSANERVLVRLLEQDRQEAIKAELRKREEIEKEEYWRKDVITQPNIFNNDCGNSILKQGKLFSLGGQ